MTTSQTTASHLLLGICSLAFIDPKSLVDSSIKITPPALKNEGNNSPGLADFSENLSPKWHSFAMEDWYQAPLVYLQAELKNLP